MGKPQKIEVGDKFMLNCGVEVTVLENSGWDKILVIDEEGNEQVVKADPLRRGCVAFTVNGKRMVKSFKDQPLRIVSVGDIYPTENWGDVKVVDVLESPKLVVEFVNTGYRAKTSRTSLFSGQIRDVTAYEFSVFTKIPVGSIFDSKNNGKYEILKVESCNKILVRWHDTNHEQWIKSVNIRKNDVRDKSVKVVRSDYLKPKGYYVYIAKFNEAVYYVGFGKGSRYLHCNSGASNSYKLNREHFNGITFEIQIYKDGLEKDVAENLEKELIDKLRPTCNIAHTAHFRKQESQD